MSKRLLMTLIALLIAFMPVFADVLLYDNSGPVGMPMTMPELQEDAMFLPGNPGVWEITLVKIKSPGLVAAPLRLYDHKWALLYEGIPGPPDPEGWSSLHIPAGKLTQDKCYVGYSGAWMASVDMPSMGTTDPSLYVNKQPMLMGFLTLQIYGQKPAFHFNCTSTPDNVPIEVTNPFPGGTTETKITPFIETVRSDTGIQFYAPPLPNHNFMGWSIDDGAPTTTNPILLIADANHNVKAIYSPIQTYYNHLVNIDVRNRTGIVANDFMIRLYNVMPWDIASYWINGFPYYWIHPLWDPIAKRVVGSDLHWYGAYVQPWDWVHVGLVLNRLVNPPNIQYWWTWWCCPILPQPYIPNTWQWWMFNPDTGFPIDIIVYPPPPVWKPSPVPPPDPMPPVLVERRVNFSNAHIGLSDLMRTGPGSDLWMTGMPIDPIPVPLNNGETLVYDYSSTPGPADTNGYAMMYYIYDATGDPVMWVGNAVNMMPKPPVRTLNVSSTPVNGAYIGVSPKDINGLGSAPTAFARNYTHGQLVKLSAGNLPGHVFQYWMVNGVRYPGRTINVSMNANMNAVAFYKPWQTARQFNGYLSYFYFWNRTGRIINDFHMLLYGVYWLDLDWFWLGMFPQAVPYPIYGPGGYHIGTGLLWKGVDIHPGMRGHFGFRLRRWIPAWNVAWWWSWNHCTIWPQPWLPNIWQNWRFNFIGSNPVPVDVISYPPPPEIAPNPVMPPTVPEPVMIQRRAAVTPGQIMPQDLNREGMLWNSATIIDPFPVIMNQGGPDLEFDFSMLPQPIQSDGYAMMYDVYNPQGEQIAWFGNAVNIENPSLATLEVQSKPFAGVRVQVDPPDISGVGEGITPFKRTYQKGTAVVLEVDDVPDAPFLYWEVDGEALEGNPIVVEMDGDHTATAVFAGPPEINVKGIVKLDDIAGQNPEYHYRAWFRIYKPGNPDCNNPDYIAVSDLGPGGEYHFTMPPMGPNCRVLIKPGTPLNKDPHFRYHWLARRVGGVDLSADVTIPTVLALNGDSNDDNVVDAFDYTLLMQAYDIAEDVAIGETDLNNDGMVDAFDFTLMMINYDRSGDTCN